MNALKIFLMLIAALFLIYPVQSEDKPKLKVGIEAPDFTLEDPYGNQYTLSYYRDKNPVVIYFYPKAGTSGCTKQACGIRDNWKKFKDNDIKVFGISVDTIEEIDKFMYEHALNFPLLADTSKSIARQYGALRDDGLAKRVTFIIDMKGIISKIIEVKDIDSHAEQVLAEVLKLKD
jgi:peroxiredoxin Q/BCP